MKKHSNKQLGMTLIELLIALGLGLFMLAGILQVFVGSRQSFEIIQGHNSTQEAGRFGLYFIEQTGLHAGYVNTGVYLNGFADSILNSLSQDAYEAQWPAANEFTAGSVVGSPTIIAAAAGSDTLSFRLQSNIDGTMLDCEGRALVSTAGGINTIRFYVDGSDNQLYCEVVGSGRGAVALVSGVENMQVLYGISGAIESRDVVDYVPAGTLGTSVDLWKRVVSVRVGLMTISDSTALDRTSKAYALLDKNITGPADGRVRQVYTKTIAIRSKMNG